MKLTKVHHDPISSHEEISRSEKKPLLTSSLRRISIAVIAAWIVFSSWSLKSPVVIRSLSMNSRIPLRNKGHRSKSHSGRGRSFGEKNRAIHLKTKRDALPSGLLAAPNPQCQCQDAKRFDGISKLIRIFPRESCLEVQEIVLPSLGVSSFVLENYDPFRFLN